jgi:hypothetical protein
LDLLLQWMERDMLFFRYFELPVSAFLQLYVKRNDLDANILCKLIVLITMSSTCLLTASPDNTFIGDIEMDEDRYINLINAFNHARDVYGYSSFFKIEQMDF